MFTTPFRRYSAARSRGLMFKTAFDLGLTARALCFRPLSRATQCAKLGFRHIREALRRLGNLSSFAQIPSAVLCLTIGCLCVYAQNPAPTADTQKKANTRPAETKPPTAGDPFAGASVEKMTGQCVTIDTEQGAIVIEMLPAAAPESARNFLNLAASGSLDTTTFSRTVKDFVIQGGNLSTSEKWNAELAARMSRRLPDEPGGLKHVRGIVSMARTEEANSATTHFFILVGDGPHLDGKFAAFGRVVRGMEVADAINRAPAEGETPITPVRIKHAGVAQCGK